MNSILSPRRLKACSGLSGLLLGGLLLSFGSARAEDWRQFRGPAGQGVSESPDVAVTWNRDQGLAWKTELPGPGASSPVVAGDRIFVTAYSGYAVPGKPGGDIAALQRHVLCLNHDDGKILWQKDIPAALPEQLKVREHGYASSTPAADAERLYVFLGKSGVFAFGHDGHRLWQSDVGQKVHGWGSATSPVLYKDLVLINAAVESESLVALNKRTGREIWRASGIKESWNTPLLVPLANGKTELALGIFGKVLGFDPDSGASLWSCDTGIGWYMVPSLVRHNDVVYCIGGRAGGALAVRTGGRGDVTATHRLWTLGKGSNVSSPLYHRGHLFWMHENLGIAACAEAATGKLVYEERLDGGGQFYASPVLAGEKLYYVSRRGTVFVVAARPAFELLAKNEMGDRSTFDASPVVDDDRLLIRSDRYLYCVRGKR